LVESANSQCLLTGQFDRSCSNGARKVLHQQWPLIWLTPCPRSSLTCFNDRGRSFRHLRLNLSTSDKNLMNVTVKKLSQK